MLARDKQALNTSNYTLSIHDPLTITTRNQAAHRGETG